MLQSFIAKAPKETMDHFISKLNGYKMKSNGGDELTLQGCLKVLKDPQVDYLRDTEVLHSPHIFELNCSEPFNSYQIFLLVDFNVGNWNSESIYGFVSVSDLQTKISTLSEAQRTGHMSHSELQKFWGELATANSTILLTGDDHSKFFIDLGASVIECYKPSNSEITQSDPPLKTPPRSKGRQINFSLTD